MGNKKINVAKIFQDNEEDFQDWAYACGYCMICEEKVFDPDYGHHVCPYEDGPEAHRWCPFFAEVEEALEEKLLAQIDEDAE